MPTDSITIKSCAPVKSGVNTKGQPWTLYRVIAVTKTGANQEFTSFDAGWGLCVGETLTVKYTPQQKGKFLNYLLGDAPARDQVATATRPLAGPVVPAPQEDGPDKFGELVHRLDVIHGLLMEIREKFS